MKTNLPLLSLCTILTACVYSEELDDIPTAKQETILSYSMPTIIENKEAAYNRNIPNEAFAQVNICIRNQMPNLHLIVENIRLCNIHLSGKYHFASEQQTSYWETDTTRNTLILETGHLELGPNEEMFFPKKGSIPFIPQSSKAWNPTTLPQHKEECYLLLNCQISDEVTIWSDEKGNGVEAAIPLSIHFRSNEASVIVLTLSPDCPWYNIQGSSPQPLFVPIMFDVSVEDWK